MPCQIKKCVMTKSVLLPIMLSCCILNVAAQEKIQPEEYDVYRAWLNQSFIKPETKLIVVLRTTAIHSDDYYDLSRDKRRKLSSLQSSTLRDYKLRNRTSLYLNDDFGVSPTIQLTSEDQFNFFPNGSPAFVGRFGAKCRISFSRVGLNKKHDQALLLVNLFDNSGGKFAIGYYYLLSNNGGSWIIKQSVMSWEF